MKQVSLKHHYLPEFYTKRWASGVEKILCEFSRPTPAKNSVQPKRVSPTQTGHERGLYEIKGVPAEQAQIVEDRFFKQVDTLANQAMALLESDNTMTNNPSMRSAWSRFMLSLLLRAPNDLKHFRQDYLTKLMEGIEQLDERWQAVRKPDEPTTIREAVALQEPDLAQRNATLMLRRLIDHPNICGGINNMRWMVIDAVDTGIELLTSDRPVIAPPNFLAPEGFILMPLGPTKIFAAAKDVAIAQRIWAGNRRELARAMNEQVVGQAEKYAYGRDDSQLDFVRQFIFTTPQPSLFERLTRFQKQRQAVNI